MELLQIATAFGYYKVRWTVITNCNTELFYYKVRNGLLQIATGITKCDGFITKWDGSYKLWQDNIRLHRIHVRRRFLLTTILNVELEDESVILTTKKWVFMIPNI